jgi:hypothetical protein|tara:strand:- start:37 stop:264 length:228 start_codon:yes stop_codon:yes gene_type:complete
MKPTQTIEQAEVLLCNLFALRDSQTDDFRIEHDDVVVTLQTAVNLLRMAQDALYEINTYSMVDNITVLNEWKNDG